MLDSTPQTERRTDADIHEALVQARHALDVAGASLHNDPDGTCDDILAARLLIETALVKLSILQQ
jgi:hypothetical protein